MSLSENEVRALLVTAMAYDNRKPGEAAVAAWTDAAHRGGWTFPEALEAIKAHHVENLDFVKPAHITARLRQDRRYPAPFAELPAAHEPADDETRERIMRMVGDRFALPREIAPVRNAWTPKSPEHRTAREAARAELAAIAMPLPADTEASGRPPEPAREDPP